MVTIGILPVLPNSPTVSIRLASTPAEVTETHNGDTGLNSIEEAIIDERRKGPGLLVKDEDFGKKKKCSAPLES